MPLAADGGGGGNYLGLVVILLLFAFMYFALIRPQNRRRREAMEMQSGLVPGTDIVTVGGLHGTVTSVNDDDTITLSVAPGIELKFARGAVARVLARPAAPVDDAEADAGSDATKSTESA